MRPPAIEPEDGHWLRAYGQLAASLGWPLLPILAGKKMPAIKGWQARTDVTTSSDLSEWNRENWTGIGIQTGAAWNIIAIDWDLPPERDDLLAELVEMTIRHLGRAPTKTGKKGVTFLYRLAEGMPTPRRAAMARVGDILGARSQTVALAHHADTGRPYRWPDDLDPTNMKPTSLPVITPDGWDAFTAELLAWRKAHPEFGRVAGGRRGGSQNVGGKAELVRDPVTGLVTDGRDDYIRALMAYAYATVKRAGGDPSTLGEWLWARAQEEIDLSRPNANGAPYDQALIESKLRSMVDRDAAGLLRLQMFVEDKATEATPVEAKLENILARLGRAVVPEEAPADLEPLPPATPIGEASASVRRVLDTAPVNKVTGVQVSTGGGKTFAALGYAVDHANREHESEDRQVLIYAAETRALRDQFAADLRDRLGERFDEHVTILAPRDEAPDSVPQESWCGRVEKVQAVKQAGLSVNRSCCIATRKPKVVEGGDGEVKAEVVAKCPFHDVCGFKRSEAMAMKNASIIVMTHAALKDSAYLRLIAKRKIVMTIVDEDITKTIAHEKARISKEALFGTTFSIEEAAEAVVKEEDNYSQHVADAANLGFVPVSWGIIAQTFASGRHIRAGELRAAFLAAGIHDPVGVISLIARTAQKRIENIEREHRVGVLDSDVQRIRDRTLGAETMLPTVRGVMAVCLEASRIVRELADEQESGRVTHLVKDRQLHVSIWRVRRLHKMLTTGAIVLMDATLVRPELLAEAVPEGAEIVLADPIRVEDGPEVRSEFMFWRAAGKTALHGRDAKPAQGTASHTANMLGLASYLNAIVVARRGESILVTSDLATETALEGLIHPSIMLGHRGALAGLNTWERVRIHVNVGETIPTIADVEQQAAIIRGYRPAGELRDWERSNDVQRLSDGRVVNMPGVAISHPDPLADAIRDRVQRAGTLQAIGRSRSTRRDNPAEPLAQIHVGCRPLDGFVPDELTDGLPIVPENFLTVSKDVVAANRRSAHAACPELVAPLHDGVIDELPTLDQLPEMLAEALAEGAVARLPFDAGNGGDGISPRWVPDSLLESLKAFGDPPRANRVTPTVLVSKVNGHTIEFVELSPGAAMRSVDSGAYVMSLRNRLAEHVAEHGVAILSPSILAKESDGRWSDVVRRAKKDPIAWPDELPGEWVAEVTLKPARGRPTGKISYAVASTFEAIASHPDVLSVGKIYVSPAPVTKAIDPKPQPSPVAPEPEKRRPILLEAVQAGPGVPHAATVTRLTRRAGIVTADVEIHPEMEPLRVKHGDGTALAGQLLQAHGLNENVVIWLRDRTPWGYDPLLMVEAA
ncbi:hypothetical protein ABB55_03255 [Prosthecomicrobium hirschii]|uniref:DNA primase/polymerase bifunctional N-terminal domain-containing protein n=1 Tax=Prosthecodimorpha hirschii TaxID=665126 RepID=A0A0P6VMF5_9HYPH|nr:hypothetical protein ABB55_03255 [Prosthecomicrobium hirschii]